MKQHKLAQKRHAKKLKRKNKKYDHNKIMRMDPLKKQRERQDAEVIVA